MDDKRSTKGKANRRSLADRMKCYEDVTTGISLIERLPIYARIDMRAGHTFCRGLDAPFDSAFSQAMHDATRHLVEKTGAILGHCQSDEASFVWLDSSKIPFGTRLFKLQSVLASMFTSAFLKACLAGKLRDRALKLLPSFDCRAMNMPDLEECANMVLWRVRDSVKNSITLLALTKFSNSQLHKKNSDDKIRMLRDEAGIDWETALTYDQKYGAFFRRELYQKVLTEDEIKKIPSRNLPQADGNGQLAVARSHVAMADFNGNNLLKISNKAGVLFNREEPIVKDTNAAFKSATTTLNKGMA